LYLALATRTKKNGNEVFRSNKRKCFAPYFSRRLFCHMPNFNKGFFRIFFSKRFLLDHATFVTICIQELYKCPAVQNVKKNHVHVAPISRFAKHADAFIVFHVLQFALIASIQYASAIASHVFNVVQFNAETVRNLLLVIVAFKVSVRNAKIRFMCRQIALGQIFVANALLKAKTMVFFCILFV